jgi:hypothetical protein
MEEAKARASAYRDRATELRAIAEMDRHAQTYDALMKVANDYDRMALSMDVVAESKAALAKSQISN